MPVRTWCLSKGASRPSCDRTTRLPSYAHQDAVHLWWQVFVTQSGEWKKFCCKEQPCHFYNSHEVQIRPKKGAPSDERRGSVYPIELCYLLSNAA